MSAQGSRKEWQGGDGLSATAAIGSAEELLRERRHRRLARERDDLWDLAAALIDRQVVLERELALARRAAAAGGSLARVRAAWLRARAATLRAPRGARS